MPVWRANGAYGHFTMAEAARRIRAARQEQTYCVKANGFGGGQGGYPETWRRPRLRIDDIVRGGLGGSARSGD